MTRAFLQAHMPTRREGPVATAKRLARWFADVAELDSSFARWRIVGRKKPLAIDEASLTQTLASSALRDDDGNPMPSSGVGLILASVDHSSTALHFRVGLPDGAMTDNFFVQFPRTAPPSLAAAERILRATVTAWQPSWATIATDDWADLFPSRPFVGWLTYLRSAAFVTTAARSQPLDDGTAVVLSDSPPIPGDAAILSLADVVTRELVAAGNPLANRS